MKKLLTVILSSAILLGVLSPAAVLAQDEKKPLSVLDSSTVVLDRERMLISHVCGIPDAATLIAQFANDSDDITITCNSSPLSSKDKVPNGSLLTCKTADGEESFTVVISGDADSNASISVKDAMCILRSLAGLTPEDDSGAQDANCDGSVNVKDVMLILRYLAGWDVAVGAEDIVYTEEAIKAPAEDERIILSFGNDLDKHDCYTMAKTGKNTDTIRIAKNEIGFTQLFLSSYTDVEGLTISISDFTSQKGHRLKTGLFSEYCFEVEDAATKNTVYYADALPPVQGEFKIDSLCTRGFVIKAYTDADSAPGLYRATVNVNMGTKTVKKAYVYADVWSFALSDDTACATAFGLSHYAIYMDYRQYDPDDEVLYRAYYDFLLENRVSAYHMPFSVLDERADEYMSNPRVTSFMIDGRDGHFEAMTDKQLSDAHVKLSANEDWARKGYFYYVDEPSTYQGLLDVKESGERLAKLYPGYRLVVPYYTNTMLNGKDLTANLAESVTLWCPMSDFWTPIDCHVSGANHRFNETSIKKYGTAEERFGKEVAEGDELWWYVCISPQYPYPNFFATYQGTLTRVLFWQTYMYDITGVLYWSVNSWANGAEWRKMDGEFPYGDGKLLYSGRKFGLRAPISSIRLEQVRDGIEDYQYLTMIEEYLGKEKADEIVAKVTTGILEYTSEAKVLRSVRDEMGELLENYFKGQ